MKNFFLFFHSLDEDNKVKLINGDSKHDESNDKVGTQQDKNTVEEGFVIKEWCVYGDRELKTPDSVKPKGNSIFVGPKVAKFNNGIKNNLFVFLFYM